tara:strand:+ start:217 stop:876 length:660 start_codon:yes stop_codon:yes gene_type:complete
MLKIEKLIADEEAGQHTRVLYEIISGTDDCDEKVAARNGFEMLVGVFTVVGVLLFIILAFAFFEKVTNIELIKVLSGYLIMFGFAGLALATIHQVKFGKHLHACREIERRVSVSLKESVDIPPEFFRCETRSLIEIATTDLVRLASSELEWIKRVGEEKDPMEMATVNNILLEKREKFQKRYNLFRDLLLTPYTYEFYYEKARKERGESEENHTYSIFM